MKCESQEPNDLSRPGRNWVSLDRKLAAALTRIAHGELGRELSQKTTESLNRNEIVRGRTLLAIVFRYYAHGNNGQVLYDMNHLQSLKMKDNDIENFHNSWNLVLSELENRPDPTTLQFWYFNQIKDFRPMAEDIAHYKRCQWNKSPDYSFDWLWEASCRYISQKRSDYMQNALNRSLHNNHNSRAAPGVDKPQGRGKGDKNKRNDRSKTPKGKAKSKGKNRDRSKGDRGRSAGSDGGKGNANKSVCYAYQKGNCTRGAQCMYLHEKERGRSPTPGGNGGKARNSAPSTPLVRVSSATLVETGTVKLTPNLGNEVTPQKERGKEKEKARVRTNPQLRHPPLLCSGLSESSTLLPFPCSGFSESWTLQPFRF